MPSTMMLKPGGDVVTPMEPVGVKLAVTALGALIVIDCGFDVPERSPVNPVNTYEAFGVALTCTVVPASWYAVPGVMVPPIAGDAAVVNAYWVLNDAV